MEEQIRRVCQAFRLEGTFEGYDEIKNGHINSTYMIHYRKPDGTPKKYVLQRVNTYVFKKPEEVMENIDRVTEYLRTQASSLIPLHFHHLEDRKNFIREEDGGFWRLFNYIPSVTFNTCEDLKVMEQTGQAFGEFQQLLSSFPADTLHETIPDFHNTAARYDTLFMHVEEDPCGKVREVQEELEWLSSVRELACTLATMQREGKLPLRVTHNDTKINNVLFSQTDHRALAVIDLDTVMPGLIGCDFGDAIRFGANSEEEDSNRYDRVHVRMDLFEAFAKGFLDRVGPMLTQEEIDTLPLSAFVMTAELVVRFLDDYICGSPYFKIDYPEHNLVRARCQMALAKDMLNHMDEMAQIVQKFI